VRRGALALTLVIVGFAGGARIAAAQPQVSLDASPDGTLTLVGDGWRPGERLVVSVGRQVYPASADTTGSFEVRTGLAPGGPPAPVAVHRQADLAAAFARLGPSEAADRPHPFAVLFAKALVSGIGLLGLAATAVALATGSGRALRAYVRQRR
jgi:hypothetical protein